MADNYKELDKEQRLLRLKGIFLIFFKLGI